MDVSWLIKIFGYAAISGILFLLYSACKRLRRANLRHNILAALCAAGVWACGVFASVMALVILPIEKTDAGSAQFLGISILVLAIQMLTVWGLASLIDRHWPNAFQKKVLREIALGITLFFFVQTMKVWLF